MNQDLRSDNRRLIELRIEHADLDDAIDRLAPGGVQQEFLLRRLKKKRLQLRDQIALLESALQPDEPA
jgi:hypothetical protein